MFLALDPGSKKCGCALFEDGELTCAWGDKGKDWVNLADQVFASVKNRINPQALDRIVLEEMQVYQNSIGKDLVTLSLMGGRVTGLFPGIPVVTYLPRTWKGTMTKAKMIKRIWSKLSEEECSRVELPGDKKHAADVKDAIGIGLFCEGRLGR